MMRTTIRLPENLYHRLQLEAKRKQISLSRVVVDTLDKGLTKEEEVHLKRMYAALKKLKGIGDKTVTDASTTIDEVLYGEKGAWRGRDK